MLHWLREHPTGLVVVLVLVAVAFFYERSEWGRQIHDRVPDRPQRRILLADLGFVISFLTVRGMAWCILHDVGPFHNVEHGGLHIHHMVWGILLLMLVGLCWCAEIGNGDSKHSHFMSALLSLLYGAGAGMTLDEFALWLNLKDVYWQRQGHESFMAGAVFFVLCTMAYVLARGSRRGQHTPVPPS